MAVLATDNFNRADNADLGANWTVMTGENPFKIVSNAVNDQGAGASDCAERYSGIAWPNDQYSKAAITPVGVGGGASSNLGIGVLVRASSSLRQYYRVVADNTGSTLNVSMDKFVNAVYSNIWFRSLAIVSGDVLEIQVQGTTLRVYVNSVQLGADQTDGSIASGDAGINFSGVLAGTSILDNWQGGDFTAKFLLNRGLRPAPFRPGLARFSQAKKDRHNGPAYRTVYRRAA